MCKGCLYLRKRWWWEGRPPTCVSSKGGAGGVYKSPPSLESRAGEWWLADKASHTHFERGRGWWWVRIPSVTRIASGRVVVGTWQVFRAREVVLGVVVGANLFCHSNREWERLRRPSVSRFKRGRGCGGRESPPSLESQVGGCTRFG